VVNVSQILTVDKSELIDKIGTLSQTRVTQIVNGIEQLIRPTAL
jgi:mRNA-degrading endonuclease toxin of MazEF toxin-antitoxin module